MGDGVGAGDGKEAESESGFKDLLKIFGSSWEQARATPATLVSKGGLERLASVCFHDSSPQGEHPEMAQLLAKMLRWCIVDYETVGLRALARTDPRLLYAVKSIAEYLSSEFLGDKDGGRGQDEDRREGFDADHPVHYWISGSAKVLRAAEGVARAAQVVHRLGDWRDNFPLALQIAALDAGWHPVSKALAGRNEWKHGLSVKDGPCSAAAPSCTEIVVVCSFCKSFSCSQCLSDQPLDTESSPLDQERIYALMREIVDSGHTAVICAPVLCHGCQRDAKIWPVHLARQLFLNFVPPTSRARSKWRIGEESWPAIIGASSGLAEEEKRQLSPLAVLFGAGPAAVKLAAASLNTQLAAKAGLGRGGLIGWTRRKPEEIATFLFKEYGGQGPAVISQRLSKFARLVVAAVSVAEQYVLPEGASSFGKFTAALNWEQTLQLHHSRGAAPTPAIEGPGRLGTPKSPTMTRWRATFTSEWAAATASVYLPLKVEPRLRLRTLDDALTGQPGLDGSGLRDAGMLEDDDSSPRESQDESDLVFTAEEGSLGGSLDGVRELFGTPAQELPDPQQASTPRTLKKAHVGLKRVRDQESSQDEDVFTPPSTRPPRLKRRAHGQAVEKGERKTPGSAGGRRASIQGLPGPASSPLRPPRRRTSADEPGPSSRRLDSPRGRAREAAVIGPRSLSLRPSASGSREDSGGPALADSPAAPRVPVPPPWAGEGLGEYYDRASTPPEQRLDPDMDEHVDVSEDPTNEDESLVEPPRFSAGMDCRPSWTTCKQIFQRGGIELQALVSNWGAAAFHVYDEDKLEAPWDRLKVWPSEDDALPTDATQQTFISARVDMGTNLFDVLTALGDGRPIGGPSIALFNDFVSRLRVYIAQVGVARWDTAGGKSRLDISKAATEYHNLCLKLKAEAQAAIGIGVGGARAASPRAQSKTEAVDKFPQGAAPPVFDNSGGFRGWSTWRAQWRAAVASVKGRASYSTLLNLLAAYTTGQAQAIVQSYQKRATGESTTGEYQRLHDSCWAALESKFGSAEDEYSETVQELRNLPPITSVIDLPGFEKVQDLMERLEATFMATSTGKTLLAPATNDAQKVDVINKALHDLRRELDRRLPPEFLLTLGSDGSSRNAMSGSFFSKFTEIMGNMGANRPTGAEIATRLAEADRMARLEEKTFGYLYKAVAAHLLKLRPMLAAGAAGGAGASMFAVGASGVAKSSSSRPVRRTRLKAPEPPGGGCVLCLAKDHVLGSECPLAWDEARAAAKKRGVCIGCSWERGHGHTSDKTCSYKHPCRFCSDGSVHGPRYCQRRNPTGGATVPVGELGTGSATGGSDSEGTQPPLDPRNLSRVKETILPYIRSVAYDRAIDALKVYHAQGEDMWARRQDNQRRGRRGGRGRGGDPGGSLNFIGVGRAGAESERAKVPRHVPLPRTSAPVVEAVAVCGDKSVEVCLLLDDGADLSLLGRSAAAALGLRTGEVVKYVETVANQPPRLVMRPYYRVCLKNKDGSPGEVIVRMALGDNAGFGSVQTGGAVLEGGSRSGPRRMVRVDGLVGRSALAQVAPIVTSVQGQAGPVRCYSGPLGKTWAASLDKPSQEDSASVFGVSTSDLPVYEDKNRLLPRNPPHLFSLCPDDEDEWSPARLAEHLSSMEAVGLGGAVTKPSDLPIWAEIRKGIEVLPDGRLQVPLPLRPDAPPLTGQEGLCRARARMYQTAETSSDDTLGQLKDIFDQLKAKGIIVPSSGGPGKYISWFTVRKENGGLRVVLDCDASSGYSDFLFAGPSLTGKVSDLLLASRLCAVVGTADLEAAFYAVSVHPSCRKYFRIMLPRSWTKSAAREQPEVWEFSRLVMGSPPSPFLLYAAIHAVMEMGVGKGLITEDEQREFMAGLYVDDLRVSGESEEEVRGKLRKLQALFAGAQMNLTKLRTTASGDPGFSYLGVQFSPGDFMGLRAPGWARTMARKPTVAKLAALAPAVFDPHGWWVHVTLDLRKLLQRALVAGGGASTKKVFNRDLTAEEVAAMDACVEEIGCFKDFRLPRRAFDPKERFEILGFADASGDAMGLVTYALQTSFDGTRKVAFLTAKSRLAPQGTKARTIPALEASAVDLLSKHLFELCSYLGGVHNLHPFRVTLFTDSSVAWWWLAGPTEPSGLWQRSTRARIQSRGHVRLFHVPGSLNPADTPSRGGHKGADFTGPNPYHDGPGWLKEARWPVKESLVGDAAAEQALVTMVVAQADKDFVDQEKLIKGAAIARHNSPFAPNQPSAAAWKKIESIHRRTCGRSFAGVSWGSKEDSRGKVHVAEIGSWAGLVNKLSKDRRHPKDKASSQELKDKVAAEFMIAYQVVEDFETVKVIYEGKGSPKTRDLGLYTAPEDLEKWGVAPLRVGLGRNEEVLDSAGPLWLPSAARNKEVVLLFLKEAHVEQVPVESGRPGVHFNVSSTVNRLLGRVRGKAVMRTAESEIRKESFCIPCLKAATRPFKYPATPGLKAPQKTLLQPFSAAGVDLLGPFRVVGGADRSVLFCACLSTRAIWATVMPGQDADSVVGALLQLQAEYGCPQQLFSDAGSVFESVASSWARQKEERPSLHLPVWTINVPNAPWQGGSWESLVGLWKDALYRSLGKGREVPVLTSHWLQTWVKMCVAAVNERPLVPPTSSTSPISPKDFLKPKIDVAEAEHVKTIADFYGASKIREYFDSFESFFYQEWVPRLSSRSSRPAGLGVSREPIPGESCLLSPPGIKRPFPVSVLAVVRSKDGSVRSVKVQRPGHYTILEHPICHLRPFPDEQLSLLPLDKLKNVNACEIVKDKCEHGAKDHVDASEKPPPESVDVKESRGEPEAVAVVEASSELAAETASEPASEAVGEGGRPAAEQADLVGLPAAEQESAGEEPGQDEDQRGRPRRKARGIPRSEWAWSPEGRSVHAISGSEALPRPSMLKAGTKVSGPPKKVSWDRQLAVRVLPVGLKGGPVVSGPPWGRSPPEEFKAPLGGESKGKARRRGRDPSPRRPCTPEGRLQQAPILPTLM